MNCKTNLPLCGSIKRLAGQSRFSLATARVITSTSSSYWGKRKGVISPAFPTSTSSEEDKRNAAAAAEGKYPSGGHPILGSGHLIGEDGVRDSLVSDPSIRSCCERHERCRCSTSTEAGPAPRGTLMKEPSLEKKAFRERSKRRGSLLQCGQSAPSRAASACLAPNAHLRINSVRTEEHTACNVIHFSRLCALP